MPAFLMRFFKEIYMNLAKTNLNSQALCEKIGARTRYIKEMCSIVDRFIAPSQYLKKEYVEFGIPDDKIKFIPHGIDIVPFKNFERKKSDKIRFGFIGTILPAKGVDILVKAFSRIKDKRLELMIYGRLFPYRDFEYYPRHLERLSKNKNIRFMNEFDYKDISRVFSEIDILVLPSIWNENCPLTILEAFSTKTPIIASNIGGIPELIRDRVDGLLFEPRNCDDLYEKIQIFLNNPGLVEKLKERINPPKNIKENTRELEKIYSDLLKAK
jgi:glycosyltransferase involved in cell wall biosynthesis